MVAGLEPLLASDEPIGLQDKSGHSRWFTVSDGYVSFGKHRVAYGTPPQDATGPVAVLTSDGTSSSGEITLLAVRGHSPARTFGQATFGVPGDAASYTLTNKAQIRLTDAVAVLPNGRTYTASISPDVAIAPTSRLEPDQTLVTASTWTKSQCAAGHK